MKYKSYFVGTNYQKMKTDHNTVFNLLNTCLAKKFCITATWFQPQRFYLTLCQKGRSKPKWRLDIEDHKNLLEIIKDKEDPDHMYQQLPE